MSKPHEVTLNPSFSGYDFLDLDIGVHIPGDGVRVRLDVNLGGDDEPDLTGNVTKCDIQGKLRLKLGPLVTPLPCAGFIQLGFVTKPTMELATRFKLHESVGLPVGVSFEAIDRFIQRLVENLLENVLSWPRCVTVPLAHFTLGESYAQSLRVASTAPIGALRLEVLRCENLLNNDISGYSDPYVVARVGQREERTSVIQDTLNPDWPHPKTFIFDVHESTQACNLQVFDSEADQFGTFNDALLGTARLNLDDLKTSKNNNSSSSSSNNNNNNNNNNNTPGRTAAIEVTLPLDVSGYDGKLKKFHGLREPPTSTLTVVARFSLVSDAQREANKRYSILPLLLACAVAFAAFAAATLFTLNSLAARLLAQTASLAVSIIILAGLTFILVLGISL